MNAFAIAGNVVGRKAKNGGNGIGCKEQVMYTLDTTGTFAVAEIEDDVIWNKHAGERLLLPDAGGMRPDGCNPAQGGVIDGRKHGEDMEPKLRVRRLMPIECERLMGFPDDWTRIPWRGKPADECPDSTRYKACGNSMCVNCMEWIGLGIQFVENEMKDNKQ